MQSLDISGASRLVIIQLVTTVILMLLAWVLSAAVALHVLAGGLIASVVTAIFVVLIFTGQTQDATASAAWMLAAEFIKLAVAAALIAAYFYGNRPEGSAQAVGFFFGFIIVYLLPGLVSLRRGRSESDQ